MGAGARAHDQGSDQRGDSDPDGLAEWQVARIMLTISSRHCTRIMNKRIVALLLPPAAAAFLLPSGIVTQSAAETSEQPAMNQSRQAVRTGYAPVNGLRIYFEIHGVAKPTQPPPGVADGGGGAAPDACG